MKLKSIICLIIVLSVFGGCANKPPSDRFLTSTLAIPPSGGSSEIEKLHLRAVDLYNLFDLNVTKKWERVHENSWKIVIDGKDTFTGKSSRMVITLAVDPNTDRTVVVRSITEGGKDYPPEAIAELIRKLDTNFIPKGQ